jgi:hypothetical protein
MTIEPRDPFSEVVDTSRRWNPEWYTWLNDMAAVVNSSTVTILRDPTTTFYVRPDGSDANNGLVNSPSGAFKTIGQAVAYVSENYDINFKGVTISVADGTYVEFVVLPPLRRVQTGTGGGNQLINIIGNEANPQNVIIDASIFGFFCLVSENFGWRVSGFKFTNTGGGHIFVGQGGFLCLGVNEFGVASGNHMTVEDKGFIQIDNNYRISGGGNIHLSVKRLSYFLSFPLTVTITGTPIFNAAFIHVDDVSLARMNNYTVTGSAGGRRFLVERNSVISIDNNSLTYFPGSVDGTIGPGCLYGEEDSPREYVPVTVAQLPPSPVAGNRAMVSDSSTIVLGSTVTGSGANTVLVWYNGTAWKVLGI